MGEMPLFVRPDASQDAPADGDFSVGNMVDDMAEDMARDMFAAIGRLICAWGRMECDLERKIAHMRASAGDVRTIGSRTRPGMARLFAELRAIVSMRDRRGATALTEIAEIERQVQRLDRFRMLIIDGFTHAEENGFLCRDGKNLLIHVGDEQLLRETRALESVGARLLAL